MPLPRLFTFVAGKITAIALGIQSSAGAADADKMIATNAQGKLDASFLPAGVGAALTIVQASENLAAGDYVDVYTSAGASRVRKADAATLKAADGFVLAAVTSGQNATVYPPGELNNQLTGLTPGTDYFLSPTVPGGVTPTAPSTTGQLYQRLGVASSATEMLAQIDPPVELA